MIDFNALNEEERKQLGATLCGQLSAAQAAGNADDIGYERILKDATKYSVSRQTLPANSYCDYRDKTVQRASRVRTSLLTANPPRPSVLPRTEYDPVLAKVIRQLDDFYWETKRIPLKYTLMTASMVDYGTAGLMPAMVKVDGQWDIDVIIVTLRELILGDWTQWDVSQQPFWARIGKMKITQARAKFEKFASEIAPQTGTGEHGGIDKVFDNFWAASGGDAVKNPFITREQAKEAYLSGNVIYVEYWTKDDDGKVIRSYLINNRPVSYELTDYPDYPLCLFRNYMRENSALGISETEIAKDVTDARTEIMQSILLQNAALAKSIVEYNRQSGVTQADIDDLLNNNVSKLGVDAEFFGNAVKVHQLSGQVNQAQAQLHAMLGQLGDTETQTTQWLEGTVPSGSDAAQKVGFMQQAGMQPIKSQALMMQQDGIYRFEWLMIWFYQTHLTAEMQIRIVGEYDENGKPRFLIINHDVPKDELAEAAAEAAAALQSGTPGKVYIGRQAYDPEELLEQIAMIAERVDPNDTLPVKRLNDISAARVDISVGGEDVLPYREDQHRRIVLAMFDRGLATPEMVLKAFQYPATAAEVAQLPWVEQREQQKQQAAAMEQAAMQQAAVNPAQQGALPAVQMPQNEIPQQMQERAMQQ